MRPGIIDNRARRISDHHRCLTLTATMAVAPGTITNSHIPSAVPLRPLPICSLQMSISFPVSNSNTYTPHRYPRRLLTNSRIVLVYSRRPARLPIPTFRSLHPTTIVLTHLVWAISVEPHRVLGLIAERKSGVLWGRREHLQLLGG
jgi:hypothetical protein